MTARRPATRLKAPKVARAAKDARRVATGATSHQAGHAAEWLAAALLMLKGYQILGFRLKTRGVEIDILARQGKTAVVVEVKRRRTIEAALSAVDPTQLERLRAAGAALLRQRPSLAGLQLRIDTVALAPGRIPRHRRNL